MTPQEYIDRERHKAWMNLKKANDRNDTKAAERLSEKLEVLSEIEHRLGTTLYQRQEARRLMQAAAEALAAEDSPDVDYAIAARVDGIEYTMQDLVFGLCEIANRWEEEENQ